MAHDISNSLDLAGIQTLASAAVPTSQKGAASGVASLDGSTKVVQHSSWEGVANGVATLNGSSLVNQHSIYEGQPSGVATLNAGGGVTLSQLLTPISSVQTLGFTASSSFAVWLCNSHTIGSFTATLPVANTLPNGFKFYFVNIANSGDGTAVTIAVGGGNSLFAASNTVSNGNGSSAFVTDGVNSWYQVT